MDPRLFSEAVQKALRCGRRRFLVPDVHRQLHGRRHLNITRIKSRIEKNKKKKRAPPSSGSIKDVQNLAALLTFTGNRLLEAAAAARPAQYKTCGPCVVVVVLFYDVTLRKGKKTDASYRLLCAHGPSSCSSSSRAGILLHCPSLWRDNGVDNDALQKASAVSLQD